MKVLKHSLKKMLSVFGYEICRSGTRVSFEFFENITQAYEQCLNETNNPIPPNKIRSKLLARLYGTKPSEAYFIVQAIVKCKNIKGDVCEFGVARGETSALIANEIALSGNKILHLFDSFEGLPKPTEKDKLKDDIFFLGSMNAYTGKMSCSEDVVRSRLEAVSFPSLRYVIHKGFFEELIHTDKTLPTEVCFAYVDFDFYEPIRLALNFLHSVTPKGAIIIVDDYDYFSTGSKTAVDEFINEKNSSNMCYESFIPNTLYGHFAVLTKKE